MGLDIGQNNAPASEDSPLLEAVETAIRQAIDLNQNTVRFNAVALRGREDEVAAVCTELQKKFPALKEIVPSRVDEGATIYLNKKPGRAKKLLFSYVTAEI